MFTEMCHKVLVVTEPAFLIFMTEEQYNQRNRDSLRRCYLLKTPLYLSVRLSNGNEREFKL